MRSTLKSPAMGSKCSRPRGRSVTLPPDLVAANSGTMVSGLVDRRLRRPLAHPACIGRSEGTAHPGG